MEPNLHDFPIELARLVPAPGHPPSRGTQRLHADGGALRGAFAAFDRDGLGEADVQPQPYRGSLGTAVRSNERSMEGAPFGLGDGAVRRPRIVATRLNGERLRRTREGLHLSQHDFAKAVQAAGARLGEPNGCTKRNVQKWESGEVKMPHPSVRRALEAVTQLPFVMLCTPVLPPDPDEATVELSAIASDMNALVQRMAKLSTYLAR